MSASENLPQTCQVAFKEWAVVCHALAAGRQSIILRKGGIHEGEAGFRVQNRAFWLFPTGFHQQPASLTATAEPLLAEAISQQPPAGIIRLQHLAVVERVCEIASLEAALALSGRHLWSEETVRQRFEYRQPGLFLLVCRIYSQPTPWEITDSPSFAGCKSWVPLETELSTASLKPALSDAAFAAQNAGL